MLGGAIGQKLKARRIAARTRVGGAMPVVGSQDVGLKSFKLRFVEEGRLCKLQALVQATMQERYSKNRLQGMRFDRDWPPEAVCLPSDI